MPTSLKESSHTAESVDLIVNCTSMGMSHGGAESASPLTANQIPSACLVNDLVYNPSETPLLREAARAGAATLGGIQMLVYQGAASFEMWTGRDAAVDVMIDAAATEMTFRNR
jgi:shikimate 5-dehydrogenase